MASLKEIKEEARKFYDKWRKEKTFCPALDCDVRISLMGWRHISGATGAKKRTFGDTFRRLKLLPCAREVINTSSTIQNVTVKGKRKFYVLEAMMMVADNKEKVLRKVRVILVEDKQGNKIFYSVMDKKQKSGTPHA